MNREAFDRLRERAQNEQTVLAMNAYCKSLEQQLLEAQAQVEVMRTVIKNTKPYYCTSSLVRDANKALSITPSEALQQYGNEQRALALEEAANNMASQWAKNELREMAQEWRNKK